MPHHPDTPFDDLEPAAVLTAAEVAERIRVDARSVRRAVARGDLTASRACGLRILACDAAEWWRSRTVPATPPPAAESAPASDDPLTTGLQSRSDAEVPGVGAIGSRG